MSWLATCHGRTRSASLPAAARLTAPAQPRTVRIGPAVRTVTTVDPTSSAAASAAPPPARAAPPT